MSPLKVLLLLILIYIVTSKDDDVKKKQNNDASKDSKKDTKKIDALGELKKQINMDIDSLKSDVDAFKNDITALQSGVNSIKSEVNSLQTQSESLKKINDEMSEIKTSLKKLDDNSAKFKKSLEDNDAKIEAQTVAVNNFIDENTEAGAKRSAGLTKLTKMIEEQNDRFKKITDKQNEHMKSANDNIKKFDKNFQEIEKTAKRHETKFDDIIKSIDILKKEIEKTKKDSKKNEMTNDIMKQLKEIESQTIGHKWKQFELDIKYCIGEGMDMFAYGYNVTYDKAVELKIPEYIDMAKGYIKQLLVKINFEKYMNIAGEYIKKFKAYVTDEKNINAFKKKASKATKDTIQYIKTDLIPKAKEQIIFYAVEAKKKYFELDKWVVKQKWYKQLRTQIKPLMKQGNIPKEYTNTICKSIIGIILFITLIILWSLIKVFIGCCCPVKKKPKPVATGHANEINYETKTDTSSDTSTPNEDSKINEQSNGERKD